MGNTMWLTILVYLVFLAEPAYAFGAGNIPSYGYLEGQAFRHGDIEDSIAELSMRQAGAVAAVLSVFGLGKGRFRGLMIKRVYFGNWLRDYSQAVDVGTLGRGIKRETIRLLVWVMGLMAHGYATNEFEVSW